MAPKRPPPLPKSLFIDGPLAPGTAPIAPSPSTLHPTSIVDASYLTCQSPTAYSGTKLVAFAGSALYVGVLEEQIDLQALDPIPTVSFNLQKSKDYSAVISELQDQGPVQINIDQLIPFVTESEWDVLEDLVHQLSTSGQGASAPDPASTGLEGLMERTGEPETRLEANAQTGPKRDILIAGLLPPALAPHLPSQQLLSSQLYQSYVNRMTSLSLNENVYLLLVPPALSNAQPANAKPVGTWWADKGELDRVIRMYISTALECFGTHRLVFGSSNPVIHKQRTKDCEIVSPTEWYNTVARQVIAELVAVEGAQEAKMSMDAVFANNARRVLCRPGDA